MRNSTTAWLIVIGVITVIVVYAIWPYWPNGQHPGLLGRPLDTRLGLDIQGGLRVLMSAESQAPVSAESMSEVRRVIERRVNALGVAEAVVQLAGNNRIIVELPGVSNPQAAINLVQQTALLEFVDFARVGACTAQMPTAGNYILTDRQVFLKGNPNTTATAQATSEATSAATSNVAPTVLSTVAPTIAPSATPTLNPDNRFSVIQQGTPEATVPATPEATAQATTAATAEATLPPELTNVQGSKNNPVVNPCTGQPFHTVMTGAGLNEAAAEAQTQGGAAYVVRFSLSGNEESQAFASHTAASIGQPLAIVLDGEVLSAPVIQAALTTGGVIEGNFTRDEAIALAVQLRSGALPVSLKIESTEQVGASLGQEAVQASIRAGAIGVLIVLLFLLLYYRWGGLAAALALLLFAGINFALYKLIPVTLTLSAITGFLISIGTAVDGNILIFERIKEEVRAGRPLLKAIELGFSRAWPSIRESNISSILIGLVLYFFGGQFGASAVRGFAVTLILGLLLNLFTAVIVTRTFLNVLVALRGSETSGAKVFGGE